MVNGIPTELQTTSHCNCNPYNKTTLEPDGYEPDGAKGTTIWFPKDVDLAPGGSVTWSFTDTTPYCSFTNDPNDPNPHTHACLLVYDFETKDSLPASYTPHYVKLRRKLNGSELESSHHSPIGGHNVTEDYEFLAFNNGTVYRSGQLNTLEMINDSPVNIQLKNVRIIRAYYLATLGYNYNPGGGYPCQSADSGANGTIDYTRQDYPCNYQTYGNRVSFTTFGNNGEGSTLAPGQSMKWELINPTETPHHANYVGPVACLFNFNNLQLQTDTSNHHDVHYVVKLNPTPEDPHIIGNYYHCGVGGVNWPNGFPQYPTVDLAEFPLYYNDHPGASNIVELYNDGDVNLLLLDGYDVIINGQRQSGRVNIYRFYKVANLCQDNFTNNTYTDDTREFSNKLWDTLKTDINNSTVTENNQLQIQMTPPSGSWVQAGYITHNEYDVQQLYDANQQGFEAIIDVTSMGALKEMSILISGDTPTTTQDPASLSNWYRIVKCATDSTIKVQNRLSGGSVSTKVSESWAVTTPTGTGQLKIKVSTGSIAFYENGILKYAEPFALPSNKFRLYILCKLKSEWNRDLR
jgi:hypothetical protein